MPKGETKATPGPWRFAESKGGKWFMYGPDDRPIVIPNVHATGRSKEEIEANFRLIVVAVNQFRESWKL